MIHLLIKGVTYFESFLCLFHWRWKCELMSCFGQQKNPLSSGLLYSKSGLNLLGIRTIINYYTTCYVFSWELNARVWWSQYVVIELIETTITYSIFLKILTYFNIPSKGFQQLRIGTFILLSCATSFCNSWNSVQRPTDVASPDAQRWKYKMIWTPNWTNSKMCCNHIWFGNETISIYLCIIHIYWSICY